MHKITLSILTCLMASPLFAGSACQGLTQICERDMNNWNTQGHPYVCAAIGTSPTFSINMINYGNVIASALAGTALNGESTPLSFPACAAETADTNWNDIFATYFKLNVYFNVDTIVDNTEFPNAHVFGLMKISDTNGHYFGVKVGWCPCGSYVGGNCTTTPLYPPLNGPITMDYNNNTSAPFVLGHCVNGDTGGILLWVYTPNMQIPPVGTYTTNIGIQAQSIAVPLGHRAQFVKP
jgi:hypothetical protein